MPRATKETEAQREARELRESETRNARLAEIQKRQQMLKEQGDEIKDEIEALKAEASELCGNTVGEYKHDGGTVQLQPNHTWNEEQAEKVIKSISKDIYEACLETKLSAKKAKDKLPPATYRLCLKDGARPKVVFK